MEWFHKDGANIPVMERVEYAALRTNTGPYHGSSKLKLEAIAVVEPIQIKLSDLLSSWGVRSLRTGDPYIRGFMDGKHSASTTH
jgi:hypothetical protein